MKLANATFWAVWAAGLLPLLLALLLYFMPLAAPPGTVEKGELLEPGTVLEDWKITDASGEQFVYQGTWQVWLTVGSECTPACEHWRQQLGQIKQALGRDRARVQWYTLSQSTGSELRSARLDQLGDAIWLADPHGNLILRYRWQQPPRDLLRDLRRLLRVSRIG